MRNQFDQFKHLTKKTIEKKVSRKATKIMKRILWLTLAICSLLLSSCQKDYDTVTLMAEMENYSSGPKVYLDNENFACWEVDDPIKINSVIYNITNSISAGEGKGVYDVKQDKKGYVAAYPGNFATCTNSSAKSVQFTISEENCTFRELGSNNGKNVSNMMVAYATGPTGGKLIFKNVGAIIKIDIKNTKPEEPLLINDWILTISLDPSSSSNPLWCQNVVVNPETAEISSKSGPVTTISSHINATIAAGKTKSFYVNVLPIEGAKFNVTINKSPTDNVFDKTTKSLSLSKNQIGTLPIALDTPTPIPENPGHLEGDGTPGNPYQINNDNFWVLEDPQTYPSYSNSCISQTGDITWTKSSWRGIGNDDIPFTGTYNGGKHSIQIESYAGSKSCVFNNVGTGGTIDGIDRTGQIDLQPGQHNSAGVVGTVSGANVTLSNCKNSANINCNNPLNEGSPYMIGGVCGYVESSSSNFILDNCQNLGSILIGQASEDIIYLGGLCGKIDASGTDILHCYNKSDIEYSVIGSTIQIQGRVGGLVGGITSDFEMNQSLNKGAITATPNGLEAQFMVGGLIGEYSGDNNSTKITNSGNIGMITLGSGHGGGLLGHSSAMTVRNCYANGNYASGYVSGFVSTITQPGFVLKNSYNSLNNASLSTSTICEVGIENCTISNVYLKANTYNESNVGTVATNEVAVRELNNVLESGDIEWVNNETYGPIVNLDFPLW